jgi:hypothetical protein
MLVDNPDDITLVYVVCFDDLPNLFLSLCSIKTNWAGKKEILIIEDNQDVAVNCLAAVESVEFNDLWNITIIPGDRLPLKGWWRQQVYKLTSQHYTSTTWSIILDCKNILIKKETGSSFITTNAVSVPGLPFNEVKHLSEWGDDYLNNSRMITNGIDTDIVPFTITPFVFNKNLCCELMSLINLYNIEELKLTEFYTYWYFTNQKLPYKANYCVTGAYAENISFDNLDSSIIFNVHRRHFSNSILMQRLTNCLLELGVVSTQQVSQFYQLIDSVKICPINPTVL